MYALPRSLAHLPPTTSSLLYPVHVCWSRAVLPQSGSCIIRATYPPRSVCPAPRDPRPEEGHRTLPPPPSRLALLTSYRTSRDSAPRPVSSPATPASTGRSLVGVPLPPAQGSGLISRRGCSARDPLSTSQVIASSCTHYPTLDQQGHDNVP